MGETGSSPFPSVPMFGSSGPPSSGISFTKEELERAGQQIDGHIGIFDNLRTKKLSVDWPHFGVLGMGVHSAHESAIQSQHDALERARDALASWQPALREADRNYREADDSSGGPRIPGGPTIPGG